MLLNPCKFTKRKIAKSSDSICLILLQKISLRMPILKKKILFHETWIIMNRERLRDLALKYKRIKVEKFD